MIWRILGALVAVLALSAAATACGGGEQATGLAETAASSADDTDPGDTGDDTEPVDPDDDPDDDGADQDNGVDGDPAGDPADDGGAGPPAVPDDRSAFPQDAVGGDDDGRSLNELLLDIHGPTDDVAAQVNRLTSFPAVPTPAGGAVITEVMTLQNPADPADVTDLSAIASFTRLGLYSSATPDELLGLYETAYADWGYRTVKTTEESTDDAVATTIELELGDEPGRPTAEVTVSDGADTDLTLVRIEHRERTGGGDRYLELAGWARPYAPDDAPLSLVQIGTSYTRFDTFATNQIELETAWELPDQSQEETTATAQELAAASGSTFENDSGGATVVAGPDDRITLTGNNGSMRVAVLYSVDDLVGLVESIG
ncbi:MAG: hypothetical protein AAFN30_07635 [Actinomycetota bacterium]